MLIQRDPLGGNPGCAARRRDEGGSPQGVNTEVTEEHACDCDLGEEIGRAGGTIPGGRIAWMSKHKSWISLPTL